MFLKKLLLPVVLLFSMFCMTLSAAADSGQKLPNVPDRSTYEETSSVVFADHRAYFKFNDPEVVTTIVQKRWSAKLNYSDAGKRALYDYTSTQATPINTALESVQGKVSLLTPAFQTQVALLDSATNKLVIPWNIITYRYVYDSFLEQLGVSRATIDQYYQNKTFDPQILTKIPYGASYIKYGYMSTTLLKNGAMTHRPIELKIRLPRGNHGAYVEPYSQHPYEKELLLPRGSKLVIDGAHLENNNKRLVIDALYQ